MNWWERIKDQVFEGLQSLTFDGIYADDVQEIIESKDFLRDEYIKRIRVCYESVELSLLQLSDTFGLLTGDSEAFVSGIRHKIKGLLNHESLQRQEEIKWNTQVQSRVKESA